MKNCIVNLKAGLIPYEMCRGGRRKVTWYLGSCGLPSQSSSYLNNGEPQFPLIRMKDEDGPPFHLS